MKNKIVIDNKSHSCPAGGRRRRVPLRGRPPNIRPVDPSYTKERGRRDQAFPSLDRPKHRERDPTANGASRLPTKSIASKEQRLNSEPLNSLHAAGSREEKDVLCIAISTHHPYTALRRVEQAGRT